MFKPAIYLLLGPETGLKEEFIRDEIKKYEDKTGVKAELFKFFAFETPPTELLMTLKTGLLFADWKAIILYNLEAYKKQDLALLAEYGKKPCLGSLLFLCSEETRLALGGLEEVIPPHNSKIFWELLEHQKKGFIKHYFNKIGMKITDEAVDFLVEMVENSTKDLKTVCSQLESFFAQKKEINLDEIENYIYHSKEENVFTLFASLSRRDFRLACDILSKILLTNEDDPVRILGSILWQVNQAIDFFALLEDNYAPDQAFVKLGIKAKRQQRILLNLKESFSLVLLQKAVSLLAETDVLVRVSSPRLQRFLLERFIYLFVKQKN